MTDDDAVSEEDVSEDEPWTKGGGYTKKAKEFVYGGSKREETSGGADVTSGEIKEDVWYEEQKKIKPQETTSPRQAQFLGKGSTESEAEEYYRKSKEYAEARREAEAEKARELAQKDVEDSGKTQPKPKSRLQKLSEFGGRVSRSFFGGGVGVGGGVPASAAPRGGGIQIRSDGVYRMEVIEAHDQHMKDNTYRRVPESIRWKKVTGEKAISKALREYHSGGGSAGARERAMAAAPRGVAGGGGLGGVHVAVNRAMAIMGGGTPAPPGVMERVAGGGPVGSSAMDAVAVPRGAGQPIPTSYVMGGETRLFKADEVMGGGSGGGLSPLEGMVGASRSQGGGFQSLEGFLGIGGGGGGQSIHSLMGAGPKAGGGTADLLRSNGGGSTADLLMPRGRGGKSFEDLLK